MFETKNKTLVRQTKGIYQNIKEGNISTMFIGKIHQDIFEKQIELYQKQGHMLSNRFAAALFLLTADKFLWNKSKYHIKPNQINFSEIDIKGIEPNAYVLFKYAKDLTFKTTMDLLFFPWQHLRNNFTHMALTLQEKYGLQRMQLRTSEKQSAILKSALGTETTMQSICLVNFIFTAKRLSETMTERLYTLLLQLNTAINTQTSYCTV